MKIKDLNIFSKRKGAALLAGITLATLPGCGKKNVETDPQPGASISIEEETITKKNDSTTKSGSTSTGKTTGSSTGTGTESTYVDNGTEYVEYTDSTEGYTEGQTEGKTEGQTEGQTEGKTEAKTEGKTGSTGVQLPSDHRVGNSYEDPTEAKTTHKTTTTIKNKDIKVTTTTAKKTTTAKPTTKKVTTTTKVVTTAKPTTQKPTEPPTTQPPAPTYDYRLENITQSAEVFNYFAEQMNNELFRGRSLQLLDYNGKLESKVALLVLNENENYKDGVLKEVFNGYNDEIIKKGVGYFFDAPRIEEACSGYVDFNKYAIDKNVGYYMNKLQDAMKSGDESKDYSEMDKILEDFLYNEQYEDAYYNIAAFYYSLGAGVNYPESSLNGTCWDFADGGNFFGIQEDVENKVKELSRY